MFTLPELPYAYNALEPYIDEQTMTLHHDKHHATYLKNFNEAIEQLPETVNRSAEDIVAHASSFTGPLIAKIRNNGGGFINHSFFWTIMAPKSQSSEAIPAGKLNDAVVKVFGSVDMFKEKFSQTALNRFGSGWAWLVKTATGLEIVDTQNQDTPLSEGKAPILCLDVWEHAYYITYQNRRAEYIAAWWNVVNWREVEQRFIQANS